MAGTDFTAGGDDGSLEVRDEATLEVPKPPIEKLLDPQGELHGKLLGQIMSRVNASARYMTGRKDDWNRVDERLRLFASLSRKARYADKSQDTTKKEMPFPRAIVMPMSLAIAQVRQAQFLSLFLSKNPMLEIDGRSPDDVAQAKLMEAMIAYDADQMGMPLVFNGLLADADKYGLGVVYDVWEVERGTKRKPPMIEAIPGPFQGIAAKLFPKLLEPQVDRNVPVREYNLWRNVDPYMYYPDPRVPISRLQESEFQGHLSFAGRMHLLSRATKYGGPYFNLDWLAKSGESGGGDAARVFSRSEVRDRLTGDSFSIRDSGTQRESSFFAIDNQQIKIIPREWKIGEEDTPTIWWFSVGNESTIIRAHESPYDHGKFTYAAAESLPDPHATLNPGVIENLDGLQRTGDWLINARIENIRRIINLSFIYLQTMVESGDLENLGPGKHIRLSDLGEKKVLSGELTIPQIIQQLQVQDVTGSHAEAFQMLFDMAQRMTAVSDPSMGTPTQEQKTLGEVQSLLASSSQRIAMQARLYDAEAIRPLAQRAIANRQQFTTMDQYYRIVGNSARDTRGAERLMIGADDVQGDFDYVSMSGVLPADPSRNAETWGRVFQTLLTVPQIQTRADGARIDIYAVFDQMVQAMGIRDLDRFYTVAPPMMPGMVPGMMQAAMPGAPPVQVMPDEQVQQQVQAGNMVPMGGNGAPS